MDARLLSDRSMGPLGVVLGAALLALALPAAHAEVRRCEDGAGHVTYSNESCPEGTAHERHVESRPAVQVPGAGDKPLRGGGQLTVPAPSPAAPTPPNRAQEVEREKRQATLARCDDLVRRIEYAQEDLLSATASERASLELGLRRLQEEHQANCTPAQAEATAPR